MSGKVKAVFFDRDQTIIFSKAHGRAAMKPNEVHIPFEFYAPLQALSRSYKLFVVSNQGGVAHGLTTVEEVQSLNDWLHLRFREKGVTFSDWVFCPYKPGGTVKKYSIVHNDRKPNTGMVDRLVEKYDVDRSKSWFVGNDITDMECGHRAGLSTVFVNSTGVSITNYLKSISTFIADDLPDAIYKGILIQNVGEVANESK